MVKNLPDFSYEQEYWQQGELVVGADEVGRGAFAGPVVAAAVIFFPNQKIQIEINDSKKLSPKKRKIADVWIRKNALNYSIGSASASEINKLGIKKATDRAFRRAVSSLEARRLLIDGFFVPYLKSFPQSLQHRLVRGDSLSLSIAAASIIAKVYRDSLMCKLAEQSAFCQYNWQSNKGYGTPEHRFAIRTHGACRLHRMQFVAACLK